MINHLAHMLACVDPQCLLCGDDPTDGDGFAPPDQMLPERIERWLAERESATENAAREAA